MGRTPQTVPILYVGVTPSPYQRDLLRALAREEGVRLEAFYLEHLPDDSPWGAPTLEPWEIILPGFCLGRGRVRCHVNWSLPSPPRPAGWSILNTQISALTSQFLMRTGRLGARWAFWGERLNEHPPGWRARIQAACLSPVRAAPLILAVGEAASQQYRQIAPRARVSNVPYHCDLTAFVRTRREELPPVFLFCGQMIRRKGFDVLVGAIQEIAAQVPGARFLLAGRPTAEAEALLAALPAGVQGQVENLGFVAPGDLPAVFGRAGALVLPSRHDGWGVVVNQALGAGLPVVATTAVGAAADLVTDGENGLIVPPDDRASLAAALLRLARSPALRNELGQASRRRATHITPEAGARKILRALQG